MAAAFFNALANPTRARALSAGTEPAGRVHPEVVEAMGEIGLDLTTARPTRLTHELASDAQLLVTMGCGEACPFVPGLAREDWNVPDPKGQVAERVRAIREEIRVHVQQLITTRGWQRSS
jgi:arsenate reductase